VHLTKEVDMIGEICVKPVVTTSTEASVKEAARLMRAKNVGALVVVNGTGQPKGVLTDRDLVVDVLANGKDLATVRVGDVMRKDPAVIREDQGILDATKMLGKKGVRRLPVVSKQGKLIGIVALDDLLMLLGSEMGHVASALSRELGRKRM
jgi:CBS domain-containing protein